MEITANNLTSGVGMFFNYPLKVTEARKFADSLPNLNTRMVPTQTVEYTSEDGTTKTATFGGRSLIKEFEWFVNDCRKANRKSDATNIIDYLYSVGKDTIENAPDEDAMLGYYYLNNIGNKCGLRDVTNGVVTYCYPSITLFFDKSNEYSETEAQNIIDIIAKKGWEIATNIEYIYTPTEVMRNRTSKTVNKKTRLGLNASGEQFVIRACEVGGLSGHVFMTAAENLHAQSRRQDYLLELCKGVSNVIECKDRIAWIRLCQLWRFTLGTATNITVNEKYGILQILGTRNDEDDYGTSIFFEENGDKYCSSTWLVTTGDDFVKSKYNLAKVY